MSITRVSARLAPLIHWMLPGIHDHYTITGTNPYGTSTESVTVIVNPLPVIVSFTSSVRGCHPESHVS